LATIEEDGRTKSVVDAGSHKYNDTRDVVEVGKEWVETYGRDVGVGIAEWVRELLNSEL
jgi:hypothetical protein